MPAAFIFDAYKLIEISYKSNLAVGSTKPEENIKTSENNEKEKVGIRISASTVTALEEKSKFRMELIIDVSGPIEAQLRLYGFFSGTNFYENEATERDALFPIGISLLLPIARSILAGVTAQDGSVPFLIPTINVMEMLARKDVESEN